MDEPGLQLTQSKYPLEFERISQNIKYFHISERPQVFGMEEQELKCDSKNNLTQL